MTRTVVAIVSLALTGAPIGASEPDFRADDVLAYENIETARDLLKSARRKYEFVRTACRGKLDADRTLAVRVRLADCEADVEKARTALRRAVVHLRILALAYAIAGHDFPAEVLTTESDKLQRLVGDKAPTGSPFTSALSALSGVRVWLAKPTLPPNVIEAGTDLLETLVEQAAGLSRGLDWGATKEQLRKSLLHIKECQLRVRREICELRDSSRPEPWRDRAKPALEIRSEVVLGKGDRVTLRHRIEWRQYEADELEVTVTASDPSLTVPATLKLDFEKHQFRFEYEVKAGESAGEFTVTLTPAVGKPVTVQVTVK
ncbi:MAG: hypothetical protein J0I06_03600 [Planctomycetes bacterium]|nr:hypothetical protein [Planctomycetota bacterium]